MEIIGIRWCLLENANSQTGGNPTPDGTLPAQRLARHAFLYVIEVNQHMFWQHVHENNYMHCRNFKCINNTCKRHGPNRGFHKLAPMRTH